MKTHEIIALASAGFNAQQIAIIAQHQSTEAAAADTPAAPQAAVAAAGAQLQAPVYQDTDSVQKMAPANINTPATIPAPAGYQWTPPMVVPSPTPAPTPSPALAQASGQEQDLLNRLGLMLNNAAIMQSQQPPVESTDDILATIINPPELNKK